MGTVVAVKVAASGHASCTKVRRYGVTEAQAGLQAAKMNNNAKAIVIHQRASSMSSCDADPYALGRRFQHATVSAHVPLMVVDYSTYDG